ncbi:MAG TPA: type II toxin-antitoxin system prevent-host-death family antitoxin [Rudaea sp.]
MTVSLTELRQRLFQLADRVVDTGEPLIVVRRGVRLRLVREDALVQEGRLANLKPRQAVIGPPLDPRESPALWTDEPHPKPYLRVMEPAADVPPVTPKPKRRK